MSPSSNTRWRQTPEQLMVLEELYRRGLRTPNAPQIQKITAHLSHHGKIQGKNVFYWFQNHKARDRQKLRKKHLLHQHHLYHFQIPSLQPIHFQDDGVCEEVHGVMRQAWSPPPKDWMMRTYGHDSVMNMEVGPITTTTTTLPCCRSQPLQTLELFPLSSSTAANHAERDHTS